MVYDCLFDWQKQIIEEYEDRKEFGLFLDMGLGKTPLSLAFAEAHECTKILIVSINKKALEDESVEGSFFWWAKKMEFEYALHNKKVSFRKEGAKKWQRDISPSTKDILLINYEGLYKSGQSVATAYGKRKRCVLTPIIEDFIASCSGQNVAIIVDESHKIKELDSLQTLALKAIERTLSMSKANVWTYLLTGTPFTKGFEDLYSQLKFLGWEGNKTQFTEAFCVRGSIRGLLEWQQPIVGYKNVDKLYELVHRYAITIKSNSVISLPEQVFSYHRLKDTKEMLLLTSEKMKEKDILDFVEKRHIVLPYDLEESVRGGKINNPFYRNIAFPRSQMVSRDSRHFLDES